MLSLRDLAPLLSVLSLLPVGQASPAIIPGATWTATNTGKHVQAHGHGIIERDGIFYMVGEDKTDGTLFQNINCYSSSDLVEWTYEGALLSRTGEAGDLGPNRIVERPKVLFNEATQKFVMYMHIDSTDYRDARVGIATGDTVCGQYEYHRSFRPLGFQSRDMGLFQDEDGSGYLITEDREYGTRIIALTEDYLDVTEVTYGFGYFAESPALIKRNGYYFLFGSHLTGWNPNDNVYSYATSLSGPWSEWTEFAPIGSTTYRSQVSYVLPLGSDKAVYIGDRWISSNLAASTYIWLPLNISGTDVTLDWYDSWTVDVAAGTWATRGQEAAFQADEAALSNGARVLSCSECSNGQAAGYIGGSSGGRVTLNNIQASSAGRNTINVKYRNYDTTSRRMLVSVNDAEYWVDFLSTAHRRTETGSSSLHCDLRQGTNTIILKTEDDQWGPDVDELLVPV